MDILKTEDIRQIFKNKYLNKEIRVVNGIETIEIQNAHFVVDKPYILREPNYGYVKRELEWYDSKSLYVKDIPGITPKIWENVASNTGEINSNYGWCIYSAENYNQFTKCIDTLKRSKHTRQACMIYNRPSMQYDWNTDGMSDFMCTYSVQLFINEREGTDYLDYIVYMRSNDAVFGFNNDACWHLEVMNRCVDALKETYTNIKCGNLYWNAASLHVYSRHFNLLSE